MLSKRTLLALVLVVSCSLAGCYKSSPSNNQPKATQVYKASYEQNISLEAKQTKPEVYAAAPNQGLNPPAKYTDLVPKEDKNDTVLFYAKEDLDLDGYDEIVLAYGTAGPKVNLHPPIFPRCLV